jgi:hypothetical protein
MKCVFCGNGDANFKSALAEGGLVKLPVCSKDESFVTESYDNPFSMKSIIGFQKEVINANN